MMEDGRTGKRKPQSNVDRSVSRRTSWSGTRRTRWKTGTLEEAQSDEMSLSPQWKSVSLSLAAQVT